MLSSKFLFSVDVRSKIRHVFALILNFEKRYHYQNKQKIILNFLEIRKNDFLMQKGYYAVSLVRNGS